VPQLLSELRAHRTVHLPDVSGLADPWTAEHALFTRLLLRSVLVVPMSTDGRLVGFVGFDAVQAPRTFTDEESTVLRSAGAAISQLLARVQAESAIRRSEARYRALVAGVPDLLVRVDQAGRVLDWRPGNQTGFRPAATTVGLPLAEVAPEVADALRTAEARGGQPAPTTVVAVEAVATTTPRSLEVRITTAGASRSSSCATSPSSAGCRPRSSTPPTTTPSPASPTDGSSPPGWRGRCTAPRPTDRSPRPPPSSTSTSTGSRCSTTRSGTRSATRC
jgi:PAS domain-containing protein